MLVETGGKAKDKRRSKPQKDAGCCSVRNNAVAILKLTGWSLLLFGEDKAKNETFLPFLRKRMCSVFCEKEGCALS